VRDYERKYWLLWKENRDLRELNLESRNQLSEKDNQLAQCHDQETDRQKQLSTLAAENAAQQKSLKQELTAWRDLAQRYEAGRFMRLMRWLHNLRTAML